MIQFFCVLFTCVPVTAQWDVSITDAKCISTRSIWIAGSIVNVMTDIVLLIMPLPYVWNLNAPMAQRLALGGMFVSVSLKDWKKRNEVLLTLPVSRCIRQRREYCAPEHYARLRSQLQRCHVQLLRSGDLVDGRNQLWTYLRLPSQLEACRALVGPWSSLWRDFRPNRPAIERTCDTRSRQH